MKLILIEYQHHSSNYYLDWIRDTFPAVCLSGSFLLLSHSFLSHLIAGHQGGFVANYSIIYKIIIL